MTAVAVGERAGRPVIVSVDPVGALRVWDLDTGEQVLGPLTGHDGAVSAVAVGERAGRRERSRPRGELAWPDEPGQILPRLACAELLVLAASVNEVIEDWELPAPTGRRPEHCAPNWAS
jgi:hypothetical protein